MRVVILLLGILALSAFVGCQSKPMVVSESGSGSEGIKVSGNWTVEVKNPDGSLATRKQFTNHFFGQHIVAGLLSLDIESIEREIHFKIKNEVGVVEASADAKCTGSLTPPFAPPLNINMYFQRVHASAAIAPNDKGKRYDSVWNGSCTLEINGDEPKFITQVWTSLKSTPPTSLISVNDDGSKGISKFLSSKGLDEPIIVFDGQVVSATVILSVAGDY